MSPVEESPEERYVLRRVAPNLFNIKEHRIKPEAFDPNPHTELSVFYDHLQSPKYLLEKYLKIRQIPLLDPDKEIKRQKWIQDRTNNGELNVEYLYDIAGWRILRISVSLFDPTYFSFSDPDHEGHVNIRGDRDDFIRFATEWVNNNPLVTILNRDECLK